MAAAGGGSRQGQAGPVGVAPAGQLQGEAGEVGDGHLGLGVGRQPVVVGRRPAAVHDAGCLPAGPAGALGRGGLRHPDGHQRAEPPGVVDAGHPGQAGVDDDTYARHGQAALGHGGGQDHPTTRARPQGRVLRRCRLAAVQRHDVRRQIGQPTGDGVDLAGARQEHQHVAVGSASARRTVAATWSSSRGSTRSPCAGVTGRGGGAPDDGDRVQCGVGGNDGRRVAWVVVAWVDVAWPASRRPASGREPRQSVGVRRRRCGQQAQVGPQSRADVDQERERQVGVEVPFVALVEHHRGRPRPAPGPRCSRWTRTPVVTTSTRVAGPTRRSPRTVYPIAGADLLAEQRCHPAGGGPGGDPARFGDHDAPRLPVGQRERDQGGLSGPGRGHEYCRSGRVQGIRKGRQR